MKKRKRVVKRKKPVKAEAIIRVPVPPNKPWELSRDEVDIVKKSIAPGATDEELSYCLAVARRYKLDPFRSQIWFVPRKRDGERTWVPVVGINGLQHIAARDHSDYGSVSEAEYGPMHTVEYSSSGKLRTLKAPEFARVSVWKKGSELPTTANVWWDEIYPNVDNSPLVRQMPRLMLAKCARAQAIRAAYPATDGLYLAEEFAGMRPDYTREGREIVYPDAPRFYRALDENAPHGHAPGSEKAKQAEAQLRKVEEADKQFAADRLQAAPQSTPVGGGASQTQPPTQRASGAEGKPSHPRMTPHTSPPPPKTDASTEKLLNSAKKLIEKNLGPSIATNAATSAVADERSEAGKELREKTAKNAPTDTLKFKQNVSQARIPMIVKGVKWTPNSKGLEVSLDTGKKLYCFRNHKMGEDREELFNLLLVAVEKSCIFLTEQSKDKNQNQFTHIVRLLKMGEREWDETGMPILRREPATKPMREPGEEG